MMKDDEGKKKAERRRSRRAMMEAKLGRVAILLIMLGRTECAGRLERTGETRDLRSDRFGTGTWGSSRFRTDWSGTRFNASVRGLM